VKLSRQHTLDKSLITPEIIIMNIIICAYDGAKRNLNIGKYTTNSIWSSHTLLLFIHCWENVINLLHSSEPFQNSTQEATLWVHRWHSWLIVIKMYDKGRLIKCITYAQKNRTIESYLMTTWSIILSKLDHGSPRWGWVFKLIN
jgi:hypothetical protein